ncbi:hypothetical protein IW140_001866 [Coemansia sp. RSA 1813]|nr:hypothetical protein EV178_005048 [Coemansia sp. RSA 1646]KAJ1772392.1 hypothetical protein LPJ74_001482 [Coemansia sp. RSA 1843]KAJ2212115.1 hypothetical protein EV179_004912 [Coemansia sp. RSA 487]KAJ2571163.1 hypothetical protein IW140_001866 [Coemansia sp. RSA 1813]
MAAATMAASISTSPSQATKHAATSFSKAGGSERTKCPKCTHKIDAYAVDTNCAFRMCANLDCTWPFDCDNMAQCFEHDAAVPSMRKRAKKRKALASKEEQRRAKRRQSMLDKAPNTPSSRTLSMSAIGADVASQLHLSAAMPPALTAISSTTPITTDPLTSSLPFLTTPITSSSFAENDSISQLDDWLADLCNSANVNGPSSAVGMQSAVSTADYSSVLGSTISASGSNMLLSQGKYQQDTQSSPAICSKSNAETPSGARAAIPCAHGPCDSSYNEPLSTDWLESLLSSSSESSPPSLPMAAPINAASTGTGGGLLTTAPKSLLAQQQQPGQISGTSNHCGTESASFIQQFSIDGALGRDCTFLPSAASNNISCGGGSLFDSGNTNVVADIFSVFGTSPTPQPLASTPVAASSANAHSSPSATLVDDAVIPRTSRHPSPTTSNSESGADDIDAHRPISPNELALLIGSNSSGNSVPDGDKGQPVSSSAGILDPFSALLSPPSSAHLGLSSGVGKHNANGNSNALGGGGALDHCYWPSSVSNALAAPSPTVMERGDSRDSTSSALSSIVPASRSASCSDAMPFDINDLFGTAAVTTASASANDSRNAAVSSENDVPLALTSKSLPPSTESTTDNSSKPIDSMAALDTASIIDNILGKSSCTSSS